MNELEVSGVYKIVNTITNDCYVGSSKNIFARWLASQTDMLAEDWEIIK